MEKTINIPLKRHTVTPEMEAALLRALHSGTFQMGPENEALGREFAALLGRKYGVCVSNGSGGIHLSLIAMDIGPGDEVILCAGGFPSVPNTVLHVGATPVFVDSEPETGNLDVALAEKAVTPRTRAIILQHMYGNPHDMDAVGALCRRHNLRLIEDGCHSLGSTWRGAQVGTFGDVGCFSLMNKQIVAGGDGGLVVTDDESIARRIAYLRDYGSPKSATHRDWGVEELGLNYRLSEIIAASARVNITYLHAQNAQRMAQARLYHQALDGIAQVRRPRVAPEAVHTYLHYEIWAERRDALQDYLTAHGIETGIHYPVPVALNGLYRRRFGYKAGDFPVTEQLCAQALTLPNFLGITEAQIVTVARTIADFYAQNDPN